MRQFRDVDGDDRDVALLNPIRVSLIIGGRVGVRLSLPGDFHSCDSSVVKGIERVGVREGYVQKRSWRDGMGLRGVANDGRDVAGKPGKLGVCHAG